MTNALKAGIISVVNIALALAVSFGLPLSDAQQGLIAALVNSALGVWVMLTYKNSPRRIPDGAEVFDDGSVRIIDDYEDLREPMA